MIKRIKQKINSPDARIVAGNFLSLALLQVANFAMPLITLPYLARVLGVDNFGVIALATAVVAYFQTLTEYGFNFTAVREIAKKRDDKDEVVRIYSLTILSRLLLVILSFLIITICIYTIPFLYEKRLILYFTFLILPGYAITSDWFFQGMEDMKFITIFNFVSKLIFTLLVFCVIRSESDYIFQPLLIAIGDTIVGVLSCIFIFKKYNVRITLQPFKAIMKNLKDGFDMFISNFIPTIYNQLNSILLGASAGGNKAVGLFSSGNTFVSISYRVINVLSRAFYPFLARRMDQHNLYVAISFVIAIVFSLFFFFFADFIIAFFYTPEFSESAKVLKIMAFTPIAIFLMNSYGINYLVLKNNEKLLRKIVTFTSTFGIVLTAVLIYKYSYIGVAISSTVIQFLRGGMVYFFAQKHKLNNNGR